MEKFLIAAKYTRNCYFPISSGLTTYDDLYWHLRYVLGKYDWYYNKGVLTP